MTTGSALLCPRIPAGGNNLHKLRFWSHSRSIFIRIHHIMRLFFFFQSGLLLDRLPTESYLTFRCNLNRGVGVTSTCQRCYPLLWRATPYSECPYSRGRLSPCLSSFSITITITIYHIPLLFSSINLRTLLQIR